jgi:hypothetical protein
MRRALVLLLVPLCAAGLLAASGCGVTADDTAATVRGQTISTTSVDELAGDAAFVQAVLQGSTPGTNSAVLPGDTARTVLLFEIQRTSLLQEAARWGVPVTAAVRSTVRAKVQPQVPNIKPRNLDRLVDFVAAQAQVEKRLAKLDPTNKADLRRLYDGAPALWDQLCLTAVGVPSTGSAVARAQRALDSGTSLAKLPARVKQAQVAADPSQGCVTASQLPVAFRDDLKVAKVKQVRGPIVVTGSQGGTAYFYRIETTRTLTFADAGDDLSKLAAGLAQQAQQQAAAQAWLSLVLQSAVTINPRYGSTIEVSSSGQIRITPPAGPVTSLPAVTVPTGAQQAPAASSGAASSGAASSGAASSGAASSGGASPGATASTDTSGATSSSGSADATSQAPAGTSGATQTGP